MKVEVLLFAQFKEAYGSECLCIEVPYGTKIVDAVGRVLSEPSLQPLKNLPLRYAINEEFMLSDTLLKNNDRLALLSPVAGG